MAAFRPVGAAPETFTARALATIAKGDALKFGAGGVTPAGDGDRVDCFAATGGSTNDYVTAYRGSMRMIGSAAAGVNFAVAADVVLDASGYLDAGTTADTVVGTVVGDDPESGGFVEFLFDPLGASTVA